MSNYSNRRTGNIRNVFEIEDLPPVSGGVHMLDDNTHYVFKSNITISNPIELSNINTIASFEVGVNLLLYTGSGAMFQGEFSGTFVFNSALVISGTGTNSIWNIKGDGNAAANIFVASTSTFVGFERIGVIDNIGAINHTSVQYANCGVGLVFKDIPIFGYTNSPINNLVTSNSPRIVLDGVFSSISLQFNPPIVHSGESFVQFSKNSTVTGNSVINGNPFTDDLGGEFYASDKTGNITVFSNNGSGGTTVTSTAHGLTIEQVLEIVGTTSYNGVHQDIFNITTNTFDIPVVFVANDATGVFDTGDSNIFRDKNRYTSTSNGVDIDTSEIGTIGVNTNFTATISTPNVPVEINGGGTDWTGFTERRFEFEFSGDPSGSIRYTGGQEKEFVILGKITYDPVGGSSILATGYIGLNGAVLTGSMAIQESSRTTTVYPQILVRLKKNDVISQFIENNDNSNNMAIKIGTGFVVSSK